MKIIQKIVIVLSIFVILFGFYSNLYSQWELRVEGLPEWYVADPLDIAEDSTIVAFVRQSEFPRPISISHNLGNTWENYTTPDKWDGTDISIIDKNNIWFCSDSKICYSNNGGIDWELQFEDTAYTTFLNFIQFFDKDTGIVIGDASSENTPALVLKTTNGGKNWISINNDYLIGEASRDVFFPICFPSKNVGYFFGNRNKKLYKTLDGGISWETIQLPNGVGNVFMLKFYDENLGFLINDLGSNDDYLFKTIDGGKNWKQLSLLTNTWHHDIEFLPLHPEKVWFTDFDHLFYSSDTGNTWQEVNIIEGDLKARNIEFLNDSIGFILCDNGKFFATENNGGIITSAKTKDKNIVTEFRLNQNYPNPFNPNTKISYQIPTKGNITIKIYDLLGREIAELVNENKNAGFYEMDFNANNIGSGVYFYQIKFDNYIETKKMLLLK